MAQLASLAFVAIAAGGAAFLTIFLFWHPVSASVKKRVDVLVGGVAARALENRGEISAARSKMDVLKWFFTLGMARKWGVDIRPLIFALASLAAAAAAWLVSHLSIGLPVWMTIPFMVLAAWFGPHMLARMQQSRADKRFVDLFPEAIDMIVRMLRAGLPVSAAIRTVAQEAPAPINGVFALLADQIDIGISFEDALTIGSERIGLPDFRFFAAAVALQHTTGGNLVVTLEILGEIIRRRRVVRLKARAATAEVRMSAYVLGALPFLVFGELVIVNPEYLRPLIADPRGNIILVVAAGMLLLAFLIMRNMTRGVTST